MIFQCRNDKVLPPIHRECQRLEDEAIAVAINNHTGKSVALAPDEAAEPRIDSAPRPVLDSLRNSALEEIEIEPLFSARKAARHNLRPGVVDRASEKAVASILERNHIAVGGISKHLQDLATEHPIVSMQDSRARFDDKAAHRRSLTSRDNSRASGSKLATGSFALAARGLFHQQLASVR